MKAAQKNKANVKLETCPASPLNLGLFRHLTEGGLLSASALLHNPLSPGALCLCSSPPIPLDKCSHPRAPRGARLPLQAAPAEQAPATPNAGVFWCEFLSQRQRTTVPSAFLAGGGRKEGSAFLAQVSQAASFPSSASHHTQEIELLTFQKGWWHMSLCATCALQGGMCNDVSNCLYTAQRRRGVLQHSPWQIPQPTSCLSIPTYAGGTVQSLPVNLETGTKGQDLDLLETPPADLL